MKNSLMRTESVPIETPHHVPNRDTLLSYQGNMKRDRAKALMALAEWTAINSKPFIQSGQGMRPSILKSLSAHDTAAKYIFLMSFQQI